MPHAVRLAGTDRGKREDKGGKRQRAPPPHPIAQATAAPGIEAEADQRGTHRDAEGAAIDAEIRDHRWGDNAEASCMSMPSHTRISMQTATVSHWNIRIGLPDIASLNVVLAMSVTPSIVCWR